MRGTDCSQQRKPALLQDLVSASILYIIPSSKTKAGSSSAAPFGPLLGDDDTKCVSSPPQPRAARRSCRWRHRCHTSGSHSEDETPVELCLFPLPSRTSEESCSRWPRYLSGCRAVSRRPLPPASRTPSGRARGCRPPRRAFAERSVVNRALLLGQLNVTRSDTTAAGCCRSSCPLSSALDCTPRVRCRRGPAAAPMRGGGAGGERDERGPAAAAALVPRGGPGEPSAEADTWPEGAEGEAGPPTDTLSNLKYSLYLD